MTAWTRQQKKLALNLIFRINPNKHDQVFLVEPSYKGHAVGHVVTVIPHLHICFDNTHTIPRPATVSDMAVLCGLRVEDSPDISLDCVMELSLRQVSRKNKKKKKKPTRTQQVLCDNNDRAIDGLHTNEPASKKRNWNKGDRTRYNAAISID